MTTVFLKTKSSWQSSCLASKLLLTISFLFQGPKSAAREPDWLLQLISARPLIFPDTCFGQSRLPAPSPPRSSTPRPSPSLPGRGESRKPGFAMRKAKLGIQTARKGWGNLVRCLHLLRVYCMMVH